MCKLKIFVMLFVALIIACNFSETVKIESVKYMTFKANGKEYNAAQAHISNYDDGIILRGSGLVDESSFLNLSIWFPFDTSRKDRVYHIKKDSASFENFYAIGAPQDSLGVIYNDNKSIRCIYFSFTAATINRTPYDRSTSVVDTIRITEGIYFQEGVNVY